VAVGGRIDWDESALADLLTSAAGPIAIFGDGLAEKGTQEAKRLAPVSPHGSHGRKSGYLRSQIGWRRGQDERGLYWDIVSPALSVEGAPYGLFQEVGTSKMPPQPYLRPALLAIGRF
jgi:HK97 gp10 family phage protein